MTELFRSIGEVWKQYIWSPIRSFTVWDAVDIILLTAILYGVYLFIKGRRAGKLAIGLALILLCYAISDIAGLRAIHQLLAGIAPFAIILLAIIFQPELRDALEKLGSTPLGFLSHSTENSANLAHTVSEVVEAACKIAMTETDGALIVLERTTPLGDLEDKGQRLDAVVSENLLRNIFVNRAPLHDGAVIIRHNRIVAANSKLTLTTNEEVARGLGTRHRAAIGITEVSDCVVVVVSEERHTISIASNGFIKRDYNRSAAELQNEATLKTIQNNLRRDLFHLLAGTAFDEEERVTERHPIRIRFRWTLRDDADREGDVKDKLQAHRRAQRTDRPARRVDAPAAAVTPIEPQPVESDPTEDTHPIDDLS